MTEHLFQKLKLHNESDIYPYHMPGHKRRAWGELPAELYSNDITEIDGFDNLHQPEGILRELQQRAAMLYGAEETFYLVNGSTCGILSAISAAVPFGGHILMARNCHKSAYHALYLRNLTVSYLYPSCIQEYDICEAITPKQVELALGENPQAQAVFIVSPTYEGRIADVSGIAEVVHKKGIPLIVDEAHGAHLGFAKEFAPNSCMCGADLVIHSVHKTLPSLTQTALLHVKGSLVDREKLKRFLHIYQTSSPSYLLMASIDNALHYLELKGEAVFNAFANRYREMLQELSVCKHLKFLLGDCFEQDVGKLFISLKDTTLTGKQFYDILLEKYHLQLEMASESYVLAMFTVNDGVEAYRRMTEALLEIDAGLNVAACAKIGIAFDSAACPEIGIEPDVAACAKIGIAFDSAACPEIGIEPDVAACPKIGIEPDIAACPKIGIASDSAAHPENDATPEYETSDALDGEGITTLPLFVAWDKQWESIPLPLAVGRHAAEFVNLYPPGVPLLVPGEVITSKLCKRITLARTQGLTVQGIELHNESGGENMIFIRVLR